MSKYGIKIWLPVKADFHHPSTDPIKQTTKYLLTDRLTWEATKIISVYSHRWVIEEFFLECEAANRYGGSHYQERTGRNTSVMPGVLD
jgi:hypothetical protein